jgi:DNA-binding beta-propeller fold protein YncE
MPIGKHGAPARCEAQETVMPLEQTGVIAIPDSVDTSFDHGAFEPTSRLVFVAHTAWSRIEVIDCEAGCHLKTLEGFPEAAGVVAADGQVLVTNRGAASLSWIDARTRETRGVFETGLRPNGVAIVSHLNLAVVACIGNEQGPSLQVLNLKTRQQWAIDLPGRPRWCVADITGARVFLAIQEPSMVLVARLPELDEVQHWKLPSSGAHGIDIDHLANRLYVACDGGTLVELEAITGRVGSEWPLQGLPDAAFFNPASGLVHVAIAQPGLVESINPRSGVRTEVMTAAGAKTTALVPPNGLYVFSPIHRGILTLAEA